MKEKFIHLGFNEKEYKVYMYLIEYGVSAASEISRILNIPKSTINFLADNLWKKGFIKKFFKGNTGYYEADISNLEKIINDDIEEKKNFLNDLLPVLIEKNKNVISKPKITFIDGLENCKKAYLELLKVKGKFNEIGTHMDLEDAFGKKFMDNFIASRVKNKIICDAISIEGKVEQVLKKNEKIEFRELTNISKNFGLIHSTIAIYDNKVLILNLNGVFTGTLIENTEFYETMKTIFEICKSK